MDAPLLRAARRADDSAVEDLLGDLADHRTNGAACAGHPDGVALERPEHVDQAAVGGGALASSQALLSKTQSLR